MNLGHLWDVTETSLWCQYVISVACQLRSQRNMANEVEGRLLHSLESTDVALWVVYRAKPSVAWNFRLQYIPRNMHTVFALLCFVVVIHWLIFPYPSGLLHWHCGNLTIAPVPAKQPWWIWINTSCEFIMNDCITTTKQSTTKPCSWDILYACPV